MRALGARLSHVREISLSLLLAGRSESELSGSAEFVGNSRRSYPRFSRPGSASHPCAPLRVYGRSAGWGLLSGGWKPAPNSHLSQEMFVICLLPLSVYLHIQFPLVCCVKLYKPNLFSPAWSYKRFPGHGGVCSAALSQFKSFFSPERGCCVECQTAMPQTQH